LADDLAAYVGSQSAGTPIFVLPEGKGAEILRADLNAASLPYRDASGLFFDFHPLRCQTANLADADGVAPRVVQKIVRHSSLELTRCLLKPRPPPACCPALKPEGTSPRR
jgi:hypothetical protein